VETRAAQIQQAKEKLTADSEGHNRNPITLDETYSGLREDNRVVMRNTIALNLDNFRAAPEGFTARPAHTYPPLRVVAAPFASVIVPNYNGVRHLPVVLGALRAQHFTDFEMIVVDDASTDDSVALLTSRYPDVRVIENRTNVGFVRACNTGAAAARGQVIVLLNSDTEPEPTWLAELVKAFVANPQAATVTSKLLLFDRRDTLHTAGDLLGVDGIPRNRGVWEVDQGQYDAAPRLYSAAAAAPPPIAARCGRRWAASTKRSGCIWKMSTSAFGRGWRGGTRLCAGCPRLSSPQRQRRRRARQLLRRAQHDLADRQEHAAVAAAAQRPRHRLS
jgi:hypothetical protein